MSMLMRTQFVIASEARQSRHRKEGLSVNEIATSLRSSQ